jgi:D-alanyl-D-alanine dipeptidase
MDALEKKFEVFEHKITNLVYIDEYGLLGINYYYKQAKKEGMKKEELIELELFNERILVHKDIIEDLVKVDKAFQKKGFRLYLFEGYRSKKLYHLINQRMIKRLGKEETEKILNMEEMPHSSGKSVDISLWNKEKNYLIPLKNKEDGIESYFVNYYKNSKGEKEKKYFKLQKFMIKTMLKNGFRLGKRREYFHFDYKPEIPENY